MDNDVKLEKTNQPEQAPVEPSTSDGEQADVADAAEVKTEPSQATDGSEPSDEPSQDGKSEEPELSPRQIKRIERLVEKIQGGNKQPEPTKSEPAPTQTPEQVNRQMIQEELAVRDYVTTYNNDQVAIKDEYPILKEKPTILKHIDTLYEAAVGYDANTNTVRRIDIRYKEFVDAYMEGAKELSSYESSKVASDIADQAASQAIDSSTAANSNTKLTREVIANMSTEEYRRRLPEINAWVAKQ